MSDRCDKLEPLLSAWVDGELRAGERARMATHLQRCPRCRATLHELRVTQSMLRSLPTHRLPIDVVAPDAQGSRRRGLVRRVAARSTAAMVAFTMLVGVAAFAAGGEETQDATPVPVDVYVADHLVRAVGGPVSTPALPHSP